MSEALLSPRRQIVSLFHPAFTPTRRRYRGSKGEMTATTAILVGQNRTNYPRLCRSSLIEGQNWRYSPQMTRNDGNGRPVWAQSGPLPKRDATGAARRAATRTVGDRGRERPENWNATGGRQTTRGLERDSGRQTTRGLERDWGRGNDRERETTRGLERDRGRGRPGAGGSDRPENAALADGLRSGAAVATRAGHLGSKFVVDSSLVSVHTHRSSVCRGLFLHHRDEWM